MNKAKEQNYWNHQGAHVPIPFEGVKDRDGKKLFHPTCYYRVIRWGFPQKGQFYLSGGPVQGWLAPNDLFMEYWIIEPTFLAKRVQTYVRGASLTQE